MKKKKFSYLNYCDWLYQGALSTGALFVLYGFLQNELTQIPLFFKTELLLLLIAVLTFAAQLALICLGEKGVLPYAGLYLLSINAGAGILLNWQGQELTFFWHCAVLEGSCLAAACMVYIIRQIPVLRGCLLLAQVTGLVVLAILQMPLPPLCISVTFSSLLLFLVELTLWNSQNRREALGLMPLFTAAAFLLCLLPRSEKPLDWTWAKQAYTSFQETIKMQLVDLAYLLEDQDRFSFSHIGYGKEDRLGGFLMEGEQAQLHIYGNGTKNPLYLTGAVYDAYTGQDWQRMPQEASAEIIPEQDPLLNALAHSVYSHQQETLISSCLISVEYRFIKTPDLFHDLHTVKLYDYLPPFRENLPWVMDKAQGKDFTYRMLFWEVNEKSDEIQTLLRQQAWQENTLWDQALLRQEAQIYQTCTQLPKTIPSRVYELAHTIAADADNDYDRMKAFADYLSDYDYSTAPPVCPEGQDFTDYFLFDSKCGYCTYFATAMAVLGRCEGIPTRYIKGFMTPKTCSNSSMDVILTEQQAHAWTEAYIEHVGWVRFDGTPGIEETSSDRWTPVEPTGFHQEETPPLQTTAPLSPSPSESVDHPSDRWDSLVLWEIAGALAIGCALCILLLRIRNVVRRRKYAAADSMEKVTRQLKRLLRLGQLQGVALRKGETLQGYQRRIHELLDTEEYSFAQACDLYEKMRFGMKAVSTGELELLEQYGNTVENRYLTRCGFLKRIIYRVQ